MQMMRLLLGLGLIWLLAACQVAPVAAPTSAPTAAVVAATEGATTPPEPVTPTPATAATAEAPITIAPTSAAPTATATPEPVTCAATEPDMLGPFYTPGAPVRNQVGSGYVLNGVVRSADGCAAVPNAQIEVWMAGPDGVYTDDYRATMVTAADGRYRFESHFPPPYSGRPSHIHLRVSAPGFQPLVTQHYPVEGQTEATFDLVLLPE